MKYQCLECGHKGNQLMQGRCPACQSSNVKNLLKKDIPAEKEAQPVRVVMLIILWSVLLYKGYTFFVTWSFLTVSYSVSQTPTSHVEGTLSPINNIDSMV